MMQHNVSVGLKYLLRVFTKEESDPLFIIQNPHFANPRREKITLKESVVESESERERERILIMCFAPICRPKLITRS